MYAVDFEFDGQLLSDYGFIVCDFEYSNTFSKKNIGSNIVFVKNSRNNGNNFSLSNALYEECFTVEFDICKDIDRFEPDEMFISQTECRNLIRWLNRKEYKLFRFISNDENDRVCYYDASFNVELIKLHERVVGLHLKMDTDAPYGYGDVVDNELQFYNTANKLVVYDDSDEIGSVCPNVEINCLGSGTLQILNETEGTTTIIRNVSNGEVITLDGEAMTISTTYNSHRIMNDFNYVFLRIGNTYENKENIISVSIPCSVKITYRPVVKCFE